MSAQVQPVGPHPDVSVLLVGALLWNGSDDAAEVLRLVSDDDVGDPATAAVLAAIRSLVDAGKQASPQLVLDELQRIGCYRGNVPDRLRSAVASGACAQAVRNYAAAVVAAALRRRVESAGNALTTAAPTAAEAELAPMIATAAAAISDTAHRLNVLRGDGDE